MGSITRQLLICLVVGFFFCGLHCRMFTYPEPAICEYDNDCLKGAAKCVRRECHCTGRFAYGDGKKECQKWKKCTKACPSNSHCLRHPTTSAETCKCDNGFFGRPLKPECRSVDPKPGESYKFTCLSDKNCATYANCAMKRGICACFHEMEGDGENCYRSIPKRCSDDTACKDAHGKCVQGRCRCVGMYAGQGKYCRKALPCPENVTCESKNAYCMIDPLFPKKTVCKCKLEARRNIYGECVDCLQDADCKSDNKICINQECKCKDGLAMSKSGESCEPGPLHSCKTKKDCHTKAKCVKGKCFCETGSTGNGEHCRDSKPCEGNQNRECGANSKCVVDSLIPDNPHCVCSDGLAKTDDGKCVEITECFRKHDRFCPTGLICGEVSPGSYNCTCHKGYQNVPSGSSSTCQDVDECSKPGACSANSVCKNLPGSFDCKCNDGYEKNGKDCQDVDECSGGVDKCGDGEKCVNAEGGYSCDCKKGYMKKDGACVKADCKCKPYEECHKGKCRCKKKNGKGHCVGLKSGSAQVSGYLGTFSFGVLWSLALSA